MTKKFFGRGLEKMGAGNGRSGCGCRRGIGPARMLPLPGGFSGIGQRTVETMGCVRLTYAGDRGVGGRARGGQHELPAGGAAIGVAICPWEQASKPNRARVRGRRTLVGRWIDRPARWHRSLVAKRSGAGDDEAFGQRLVFFEPNDDRPRHQQEGGYHQSGNHPALPHSCAAWFMPTEMTNPTSKRG